MGSPFSIGCLLVPGGGGIYNLSIFLAQSLKNFIDNFCVFTFISILIGQCDLVPAPHNSPVEKEGSLDL